MKKQSKLLIGIIAAIAVLAVVIISIVITAAGSNKNTYNSHLELAQRYLDELQYEQAIVEYEAAIAIDPQNPEAYLGLAEVYVAMDDLEKALEVLAEGYAQTQSERIANRQEELAQVVRDLSKEIPTGEEQVTENQEDEVKGNLPDEEASQMEQTVTFIPWSEAGLDDHVMDWQDENLEAVMREITGITDRDIMLSDVWELTELDLRYNQINDICALDSLINLRQLYLRGNQISDISVLSDLVNLWYLELESNQISDISTLSSLTNLQMLNLADNQISDISALSGLTNLTVLALPSNQISDISVLSNLTNLTNLELENSQIRDISALSGLKNLEALWLDNNQISDVSALSDLKNLETLWLDNNQISDVSALSGLKNLTNLHLSNNPIDDYFAVEFIEQNGGYLYK